MWPTNYIFKTLVTNVASLPVLEISLNPVDFEL